MTKSSKGRKSKKAKSPMSDALNYEEITDAEVRRRNSHKTWHNEDRSLDDPALFLNREMSLLQFNRRVMELARDQEIPLLERLRFLSICSSNLDEFFEIRVSGVKQQILYSVDHLSADGLTPIEQFARIAAEAHDLVEEQYRVLQEEVLPGLREAGVALLRREEWSDAQRAWIEEYFNDQVLPVLTPIAIDPSHPFPRILNKSLNFIVELSGEDAFGRSGRVAVIQVPRSLPRVINLPFDVAGDAHTSVLLSAVVHAFAEALFPGMEVLGAYQFRVTRNADLFVDEEDVQDLLRAIKGELDSRKYGEEVRLEVATNISKSMKRFLLKHFELEEDDLYLVNGPVNLNRLGKWVDAVDRPDLKYKPFVAGGVEELDDNILQTIKRGDVLLHHPFQSFSPVVEMLRQAANDPDVLSIKITLYRTGDNSPLVDALIEAAKNQKDVTVVIELRARFDEAANIDLATRLQDAGANVAYGIVGYKAHAKLLLIVRREKGKLRRYVHLGTGNYHTGTAKAYTDLSLMTADKAIGRDVHHLFLQLTGLGKESKLKKMLQSPFTLEPTLHQSIDREIEIAKAGGEGRIVARMNSLSEKGIIAHLYQASRAGVSIDLIVRGVCCLRPGVKGVSENIRVRSVLGRFLEHSRVYFFGNGGQPKVFAASADWMPRNLFRRVESCFPVEDERLAARVKLEALDVYLDDNQMAWTLQSDGSYSRPPRDATDDPRSAQHFLLQWLSDF